MARSESSAASNTIEGSGSLPPPSALTTQMTAGVEVLVIEKQETATPTLASTILLVEDHPDFRNLLKQVLCEYGYQVLAAESSEDALPIIDSTAEIDLLITDVGLHGLSGLKLADAARQLRPSLKVLFMTGHVSDSALRTEFRSRGADALLKPFPLAELETAVRALLPFGAPTILTGSPLADRAARD